MKTTTFSRGYKGIDAKIYQQKKKMVLTKKRKTVDCRRESVDSDSG